MKRLLPFIVCIAVGAPLASAAPASADRYARINAALSPYLSEMINRPAAAHDRYWIKRTDLSVTRAAIGASERCLRQVRRIRRAVARTNLRATTKRKRILDALAPTYYRC
jgi:hypothetical protein